MIEVIPELQLAAQDEARIVELLEICFPKEYDGRSFFQQRPHQRVLWRDGQILGQVSVFYRAVRLGDALIDIVGLGDVVVDPDFRGTGIATAMLDAAAQEARQNGIPFALLWGGRKLYLRAGFRPAANRYTTVDMADAVTGKVLHESSEYLRVLQLGDRPWREDLQLDLLGPTF
ncbi:MAG: GNAT family N-acetyltransferase [Paracoccaceae bacterium]|nr:GNAT family N-acetyltransferase [Paracoccaceae bacterium]